MGTYAGFWLEDENLGLGGGCVERADEDVGEVEGIVRVVSG